MLQIQEQKIHAARISTPEELQDDDGEGHGLP